MSRPDKSTMIKDGVERRIPRGHRPTRAHAAGRGLSLALTQLRDVHVDLGHHASYLG